MIIEYVKNKRWQCFPTAFAMLGLDEEIPPIGSLPLTPERVMELIGHDGGFITHPGLPEPLKRRGFHIQEIIDVAISLGYAMTEIQHSPQIVSKPWKPNLGHADCLVAPTRIKEGDDASRRFKCHIDTSQGILATRTKYKSHAWAYEDGTIYDPDGDHPPMQFDEADLAKLQHTPVALWRVDRIAD